ncbi:phosphoadenosine phosphosulfate reductase [Marivivens sp.]|uniref:phosphoadenosine phosphosulfate reductase n=1 Tax=Marivivens sp. TaxID=1978374 RepID=UPI00201EC0BB|nr:phosphoadenosine phosphosulfate reductase [Marivivens sp.]MCL7406127.1 phosphoadenosine phosphosulfate reductase [Marivivens geojensis]NBQ50843.1 phosphoadenosine phosphosulfate reductase [Marivivens sp.]
MHRNNQKLRDPLTGLDFAAWRAKVEEISNEIGQFQAIGDKHFSTFVEAGSTLFVTFESAETAMEGLTDGRPLGWDYVVENGWSHLGLFSIGDTWFRHDDVYAFFDELLDDYFFDDFDQVIFFGAGPGGYAACAYSVCAPGAKVLALNPQATLSPDVTRWDDRFPQAKKLDFIERYGYAPYMVEAAEDVTILYDTSSELDALHAAMFEGPNVTHHRVRMFGIDLRRAFIEMGILKKLLGQVAAGTPTDEGFGTLMRARRNHGGYLRGLLAELVELDRPYLTAMLCRNVLSRMPAPRFRQRLDALEKAEREGLVKLPPDV